MRYLKKVGFVGWRGMVGSVLRQRLTEEKDWQRISPIFFSTSRGGSKQQVTNDYQSYLLHNAYDFEALHKLDILISCHGSAYTKRVYSQLRQQGWQGYWIDSASFLRMHDQSIIVLDPVNHELILRALEQGIKTFVGANCNVSLLLMALGGLFAHGVVEWINMATYQAISGAGASQMWNLLSQMGSLHNAISKELSDPGATILDIESKFTSKARSLNGNYPSLSMPPLMGNILPWIDESCSNGQSKEEWKSQNEAHKILGNTDLIPIDGLCVRVATLRCHSQALTIKLKRDVSIDTLRQMIVDHNQWVHIVENQPETSLKLLNPLAVSGSLAIPVGRLHKLTLGPSYLSAFTVGDQLIWGAAEPLRRMLNILIKYT